MELQEAMNSSFVAVLHFSMHHLTSIQLFPFSIPNAIVVDEFCGEFPIVSKMDLLSTLKAEMIKSRKINLKYILL